MSISSQFNRLDTQIADSYTAVGEKGGDIPTQQNMDNLPAAIRSIHQKEFTITYSTSHGTAPATKTVNYGYELTAQDLNNLPKEDWYRQEGWWNSAYSREYKVGDTVTSDITLYAKWVDKTPLDNTYWILDADSWNYYVEENNKIFFNNILCLDYRNQNQIVSHEYNESTYCTLPLHYSDNGANKTYALCNMLSGTYSLVNQYRTYFLGNDWLLSQNGGTYPSTSSNKARAIGLGKVKTDVTEHSYIVNAIEYLNAHATQYDTYEEWVIAVNALELQDQIDELQAEVEQLNGDIDELLMTMGGTPVNSDKWFDRIKKLYDDGKIADLKAFVRNGLLTPAEYEEICGEPYEE